MKLDLLKKEKSRYIDLEPFKVEEIPYTVDSQQLNLIIKNGKSIFTA